MKRTPIDTRSPFKFMDDGRKETSQGLVHVNFCCICHYVWKAPAAATQCVNCTNINTARSLVSYKTEAPIT